MTTYELAQRRERRAKRRMERNNTDAVEVLGYAAAMGSFLFAYWLLFYVTGILLSAGVM